MKLNKQKADEVIQNIHTLQYLAAHNAVQARAMLSYLALRPPLDTEGVINRAKNQVTFEAFEVLASLEPEASFGYLNGIIEEFKEVYIYHYIIGRKMAGIIVEETVRDISIQIDQKFIPKIFKQRI